MYISSMRISVEWSHFYLSSNRWNVSYCEPPTEDVTLPFIRRVELNGDDIKGVPGGDAYAAEETKEGDHARLVVAEHQEEAADARNDAGTRCMDEGGKKRLKVYY